MALKLEEFELSSMFACLLRKLPFVSGKCSFFGHLVSLGPVSLGTKPGHGLFCSQNTAAETIIKPPNMGPLQQ